MDSNTDRKELAILKSENIYLRSLLELKIKELTKYKDRIKILEKHCHVIPSFSRGGPFIGAAVYAFFDEYPEGSPYDLIAILDKAVELDTPDVVQSDLLN